MLAVFFAVEDFWIHALELPCPEEGGEVEELGEFFERDVIADGDAGVVGGLEVGVGPVAGEAFFAGGFEWDQILGRVGGGEAFALFDVFGFDFGGKGVAGLGVEQLVADLSDEGGITDTDHWLVVVWCDLDRGVCLAGSRAADE